ncbi:tyrosine--tRNA ligase [Candidatus Saganbacteria bacterium]|nr:tyrosine--tRNA ligase [Candidatus Saganbacteria bacterium]
MEAEEQFKIFKRGTAEIIPEDELLEKLRSGRKLLIKFGADPSAPDIHLGHTVVLNKLRQLQDLGHEVVFIIGDFTAQIGDPTGKSETRKPLSFEDIENNSRTYLVQIFKILDKNKTKVVFNSSWLSKLKLQDTINLAAKYNVARMLERDDFSKRFKKGDSISVHEFLYPLMQGYDSVELENDVEIGGTDQKFNMLVGRELQRGYNVPAQVIITLPILEGLDGVQKMSKSLSNYIGINEPPSEIFGKIMSVSDVLMLRYYELLTDVPMDEVKAMHPMEAKKRLAKIIVARFYSKKEADAAQVRFESVFSKGKLPEDIELLKLKEKKSTLLSILIEAKMAQSNSDAKRLIEQGGVRVDSEVVKDAKAIIDLSTEKIIQAGKRKFVKVICE